MASIDLPADLTAFDLRMLIAHRTAAVPTRLVEEVHATLARQDVDFIAILGEDRLVGVCARRELTAALGSRYGFALNARRPVTEFVMASPLLADVGMAVTDLFKAISARNTREFYDDVVLMEGGRFLGMIPMRMLVQLQTQHLLGNLSRLEASRREIAEKNRQIEDDLRMAHEVQLAMLPQARPPFPGRGGSLVVQHRYLPAGGVSGDFCHVRPVGSDAVGLLVCDVMGHGVRSALITAMVRSMVEGLRDVAACPDRMLTRLNADLTPVLRQTASFVFVTAAYVVIDLRTATLRYAQAGHPTPLRWDAGNRQLRALRCADAQAGPALGLIPDFEFAAIEEPLVRGDRVALFTDGLFEAATVGGEEFGADRLLQALSHHISEPLDRWIDLTVEEARTFAGSPFTDDVCLLAAEWA